VTTKTTTIPALDAGPAAELATTMSSDEAQTSSQLGNPEVWVDEYGDYLFRYALVRLRDESLAEDMVQETFLAALKAGSSFAGRSTAKSWLVGILKNKIVDHFRKACRETSFTNLEFYQDEEKERFIPEGVFKDGWIHELGPLEWNPDPMANLDKEAFWKTFHRCAGRLPRNISQVFLMRELDEVSTDEICAALNITANNLWVMLHRARMALRRCLEQNWFGKTEGTEYGE
jgi:RNA polymerase sigma-70 factor (ECF subfamily)